MQTRSDIDGTDPLARTAVYGALATGFGPLADDAGLTRLWSDAGWGRLGGALGLLGLDVDLDSGDGELPGSNSVRELQSDGLKVRERGFFS